MSFDTPPTVYSQEMPKTLFVLALGFCATSAFAQYTSPEATTSVTIAGKQIKIKIMIKIKLKTPNRMSLA